MTIRQLIDDTIYLATDGRFVGALTVVLAAVSASSKLTFPDGERSRFNTADGMRDAERFRLFLGARLRKLRTGRNEGPDEGRSDLELPFRGSPQRIEHILYEQFRNSLSHEGKLPVDIPFSERMGFDQDATSFGFTLAQGTLSLDHGWIALLIRAVTHARCNAHEFGIQHFEFLPRSGIDVDSLFDGLMRDHHGLTRGRIELFLSWMRNVGPHVVSAASDEELRHMFSEALGAPPLNVSSMVFTVPGLATTNDQLTPKGIAVLRCIAEAHEIVRVI